MLTKPVAECFLYNYIEITDSEIPQRHLLSLTSTNKNYKKTDSISRNYLNKNLWENEKNYKKNRRKNIHWWYEFRSNCCDFAIATDIHTYTWMYHSVKALWLKKSHNLTHKVSLNETPRNETIDEVTTFFGETCNILRYVPKNGKHLSIVVLADTKTNGFAWTDSSTKNASWSILTFLLRSMSLSFCVKSENNRKRNLI